MWLQADQCKGGKVQEMMRTCTRKGGGRTDLVGRGSARESFPKAVIDILY